MAYSSIVKPTDYFNTLLYTGTGSSNALTGVGFQPDWVFLKGRSDGDGSRIYDSVRGVTKEIYSYADDAESTNSNGLTAFGTDGFTLGSTSGINGSSKTFVAWNWLASGSTASNSNGGITSTVSANTTAGFSIVQYVGTSSDNTVGHGLGAIPKMIITKGTSASGHWSCYHNKLTNGTDSYIELNNSNAESNLTLSPDYWGTPSSTVFGVKGGYGNSINGRTYIAYCFAEIKGYSKISVYTGNGNSDGPFVYTGFKPAWVLTKRTDSTGNWHIFDNKRPGENPTDKVLNTNTSSAESDEGQGFDFCSNGFKVRESGNFVNAGGQPFIYMAFAENPFVANDSGTAVPVVAS